MIWKIGLLPSNKHGRISCNRRKKSPRETTILLFIITCFWRIYIKKSWGYVAVQSSWNCTLFLTTMLVRLELELPWEWKRNCRRHYRPRLKCGVHVVNMRENFYLHFFFFFYIEYNSNNFPYSIASNSLLTYVLADKFNKDLFTIFTILVNKPLVSFL